MTSGRVEVITSVQRRRRWSDDEKRRIVAVALAPGAVASAVAREAGIHVSQLFRWRQALCEQKVAPPAFAAVTVSPDPVAPPTLLASGAIEIEFASGARLRIVGTVDPAAVSAAIAALVCGERRR
ncbi:MAG: transposase [Alloacidobacterium sp.]